MQCLKCQLTMIRASNTIDIYDNKLSQYGDIIYKRINFFQNLFSFRKRYHQLSSDKEVVNIHYNSDINEKISLFELLKDNLEKDIRY